MPIQFSPLSDFRGGECSICLSPLEEKSCVVHEADTSEENKKVQHCFHDTCLKEALGNPTNPHSSRSCPICREVVDLTSLFNKTELEEFEKQEKSNSKKYQHLINRSLFYHGLMALFASDLLQENVDMNLYTTVGICTVASGLLGASYPHPFKHLAIMNAVFIGGAISTLSYIDPLSIRYSSLPISLIYRGLIAGFCFFGLPAKMIDRPYGFELSINQAPHTIVIAVLAWQYFRG